MWLRTLLRVYGRSRAFSTTEFMMRSSLSTSRIYRRDKVRVETAPRQVWHEGVATACRKMVRYGENPFTTEVDRVLRVAGWIIPSRDELGVDPIHRSVHSPVAQPGRTHVRQLAGPLGCVTYGTSSVPRLSGCSCPGRAGSESPFCTPGRYRAEHAHLPAREQLRGHWQPPMTTCKHTIQR